MTEQQILDKVVENNSDEYNILKLAEECTELSDVLIKIVTKADKGIDIEHLAEELGDVRLRSKVLIDKLGLESKVRTRVSSKLFGILHQINEGKYANY